MSQLRPILREYNNANNRRRITFTECENTSYEKSHEKEDTPKKFKDLIQIIPLTEEAGAFRIGDKHTFLINVFVIRFSKIKIKDKLKIYTFIS